jgi:hypothetical protein
MDSPPATIQPGCSPGHRFTWNMARGGSPCRPGSSLSLWGVGDCRSLVKHRSTPWCFTWNVTGNEARCRSAERSCRRSCEELGGLEHEPRNATGSAQFGDAGRVDLIGAVPARIRCSASQTLSSGGSGRVAWPSGRSVPSGGLDRFTAMGQESVGRSARRTPVRAFARAAARISVGAAARRRTAGACAGRSAVGAEQAAANPGHGPRRTPVTKSRLGALSDRGCRKAVLRRPYAVTFHVKRSGRGHASPSRCHVWPSGAAWIQPALLCARIGGMPAER